MKKQIIINFLILVFFIPFVFSAQQTLGGTGADGPLRIYINDDLTCRLYHEAYTHELYFSSTSCGTVLYYNESGSRNRYSSSRYGFTSFITSSNTLSDSTITTVNTAGSARITQTTSYSKGSNKYSMIINITNNGANNLTDVVVGRGGDTFYADDDSSRSYYSSSLGMLYLKNSDPDTSGIMGIYGSAQTPISAYYGGGYGAGGSWLQSDSMANYTTSSYMDAGYYAKWQNSSLEPRESWIVYVEEQVTGPGAVQVISPSSKTVPGAGDVTYEFNILNFEVGDGDFNIAASSSNGWNVTVNTPTISIAATQSAVASVTLTVPSGQSDGATDTLTLNATSVSTATIGSNTVTTIIDIPPQPEVLFNLSYISSVDENMTLNTSYGLSLNRIPQSDVTVIFSSSGQLNFSPANITFTNITWNITQNVTVWAVDDQLFEENHTGIISQSLSTLDSDFSEITVPDVLINITDNEVFSIFENLSISGIKKYNTDLILTADAINIRQNISHVWLEHNFSGTLSNTSSIPILNVSGSANFTLILELTRNQTAIYRWHANDSWSNTYDSGWLNFSVVNTDPIISVLSNNHFYSGNLSSLHINCTDDDNDTLTYGANNSDWNAEVDGNLNAIFLESNMGFHMINVSCSDPETTVYAFSNYTIYDGTAPNITIISPQQISYHESNSVMMNSTSHEEVDTWWYSLNQGSDLIFSLETMIRNLSYGNHTLDIFANDTYGNIGNAQVTFFINYSDMDNDNISDMQDNLLGNIGSVSNTGVSNLNVSFSNNYSTDTYDDVREVLFYDDTEKIINFTFNFSTSKLNLSKVVIKKTSNSLLTNFNSQLQGKKDIFINDNNFVKLCVKDAEIDDVNNVSSDCNQTYETNFVSCLGNATGITLGNLTCIDHGSIIEIKNLTHSAVVGIPKIIPSTTSRSSSSNYKHYVPTCGDNKCEFLNGENSSNCAIDCATNEEEEPVEALSDHNADISEDAETFSQNSFSDSSPTGSVIKDQLNEENPDEITENDIEREYDSSTPSSQIPYMLLLLILIAIISRYLYKKIRN